MKEVKLNFTFSVLEDEETGNPYTWASIDVHCDGKHAANEEGWIVDGKYVGLKGSSNGAVPEHYEPQVQEAYEQYIRILEHKPVTQYIRPTYPKRKR